MRDGVSIFSCGAEQSTHISPLVKLFCRGAGTCSDCACEGYVSLTCASGGLCFLAMVFACLDTPCLLGAKDSFTVALWRSWNNCQDCTWHLWADPGIELATSGSSGTLFIDVPGPFSSRSFYREAGWVGCGLQLYSGSPRSALAETSGCHVVAPTAPSTVEDTGKNSNQHQAYIKDWGLVFFCFTFVA